MIFFVFKIKNLCEQMFVFSDLKTTPFFPHSGAILTKNRDKLSLEEKEGKLRTFFVYPTSDFLISYFFQLTLRIPSDRNCENTD